MLCNKTEEGATGLPAVKFYQINRDNEIRTRDHLVIKTLILC